MHVRYWLCLALLNSISYVGQVSAILDEKPPWTGQVRATPWAPLVVAPVSSSGVKRPWAERRWCRLVHVGRAGRAVRSAWWW